MNTLSENEIVKIVLDAAFKIHSELGPGLFESVYEAVLEFELKNKYNLSVQRQVAIPVVWEEVKLELGFRADMIIEHKVIVEIKSIEAIAPVHHKQLLTYLKLTGIKLGLLLNFNEELMKTGIKRIVNNL
ncbi:MAG: GxxExxY protein [Sphingobacteriales bacterium]|nr:GxxExxY protein [Sphingobacteriales bacterium]MBI3719419.1 GxxExxY protein [Sphingobacteriales bacterium]